MDNKVAKFILIPKEYKLTDGDVDGMFFVNEDGAVPSGTIKIIDSKNKEHSITIQVGNFYAEIK